MAILSIDIGGTKILAALLDQDQNFAISELIKFDTPTNLTADSFADILEQVVKSYELDNYQAISVATTGVVFQGLLISLTPSNLGGLYQFPLVECLEKLAPGKDVVCLNDAQAATVAEYNYAKSQITDLNNLCFITVSTGVGGGFVIDDKLLLGASNLAGHIGHSAVSLNGPQCPCGRIGCVEAYASGKSIANEASKWPEPATTAQVFELWRNKNIRATLLVEQSAQTIAKMIANIVVTNDIHNFALGGSVGLAEGYLELVKQFNLKEPEVYHASIFNAHYQANSGLIGAAQYYCQLKDQEFAD